MKNFKTIDALDVEGKAVLLRLDLNVPMKDGIITDTTRIDRALPTIRLLSDKGARIVILSHFGRPKGKKNSTLSLAPVRAALENALEKEVSFTHDCIGSTATEAVKDLSNGNILLLENVRFHAEEESNDPDFAKKIAALGDIYVNDAFSTAHRAHATTEGLAHFLPAYAGKLMEAELNALQNALEKPERPVVALVGGAKISTKLDLLNNLVTKIDTLVLGGGMANTFLHAQGIDIGKSLCEKEMSENARTIMKTAKEQGCRILLPQDGVLAKEFKENPPIERKSVNSIAPDDMMLDIGPQTVTDIKHVLKNSKTLLWNGPLGAFETPPFDQGTKAVAQTAADLTKKGLLISVAGGGDTVAALAAAGTESDMTYVSTAGGAFLEWLEGKELPGVAALINQS